jgi:Domain of unknown function (DUF4382)
MLIFLAAPVAAAADRQGLLQVRIKDHREAIGDFSKLSLTIAEILISVKPGLKFWQSQWKSLAPNTPSIDLTQYVGGKSTAIFKGSLEPGSFDAVHLKLKDITATLKSGQRNAPIKNLIGSLKLPFRVQAGSETTIVLDLVVLDLKDHPPRGYELGIQGYELYTDGKLIDKVPPDGRSGP